MPVLILCGTACIFLLAVRPGWPFDPFIRNDDYLFFFPAPDLAWFNTLTEGRWLNQLWAARGFHVPASLAYVLSVALWGLTCGIVAVRILGRQAPWMVLLTALALAVQPQMGQLMLWPNVQIPANLVLLTASLGIALAAPGWVHLWLAVGAIGALHTYPTNAFVLLAIAVAVHLARPDAALRQVVWLLASFLAGCLAGLASITLLNGLVHDHPAIAVAPWRESTPAHGLSDVLRNIALLGGETEQAMLTGLAVLCLPLFGLVIAAQRGRPVAVRGMALAAALALMALIAQTLMLGTRVPNRATGFLWVYLVLAVALALALRQAPRDRRLSTVAGRGSARGPVPVLVTILVLAVGVGVAGWRMALAPEFQAYQRVTRQIAGEIAGENMRETPQSADLILIEGPLKALPEADVLAEPLALAFRLEHLTGRTAVYCSGITVAPAFHPAEQPRVDFARKAARLCAAHLPEAVAAETVEAAARSTPWTLERRSGVVILRLGERP